MRFDWYQATVPENPVVLVEALLAKLAPDGSIEEGPGRHNYRQSFTVRDRDRERVALVLAGGPNGDPNVTASGGACDAFVPALRAEWSAHRVTRADVAEDFAAEGAYEALERCCRAVATSAGVKGRSIVPDDPADGRTYYMGSPSSDVRVRLYDKTAESRRHLPPEAHASIPDHWARLEVQVRPRKQWKQAAAMLDARHFWGFSGWTTDLAAQALKLDVERITMQAGRESDHDRAVRFMIQQYGPTFLRLLEDHGDWQSVGLQIGHLLIEQRGRRRMSA